MPLVDIVATGAYLIQTSEYVSAWGVDNEQAAVRYWKAVDRRRSRWVNVYRERIRKLFANELEAMLIAFRAESSPPLALLQLEAVAEKWNEQWVDLMVDLYQTVSGSFARLVRRRVDVLLGKGLLVVGGTSCKADRPRMISDWLYEKAGTKIKGIQAVTLHQIREALTAGFNAGEGVWDLSQRIEKLGLDEIIPHRSEVIARTETMYAGNMGGHLAAKESGEELRQETWKVWISTRDDRTRGVNPRDHYNHLEMDGQRRQLYPEDEPYDVSDERMMFPMDDSMGASAGNIIQCRCTEAYEVGELLEEPIEETPAEAVAEMPEQPWETDVRNMIDAEPNTAVAYEEIGKRITDDILNDPVNRKYIDAVQEWEQNKKTLQELAELRAAGKTPSADQVLANILTEERTVALQKQIEIGNKKITEEIYDRLRRVREFGDEEISAKITETARLKVDAINQLMEDAHDQLPTDWIRQSNEASAKLTIREAEPVFGVRRASYRYGFGEMKVELHDRPVFLHEFGHRMEDINIGQSLIGTGRAKKDMGILCHEWREARRLGEKNTWLGGTYGMDENGFRDKFFRSYVGRDYGVKGKTEVLSMGLQYLNSDPIAMAIGDIGHLRFVVGLLAGV